MAGAVMEAVAELVADAAPDSFEQAALGRAETFAHTNVDLMKLLIEAWQYARGNGAPLLERCEIEPPSAAAVQMAAKGQASMHGHSKRQRLAARLTLEGIAGVLPIKAGAYGWSPAEADELDQCPPAIVQAVMAAAPWDWPGQIVDLVAWHPAKPAAWRLLTGYGTHLGALPGTTPFDDGDSLTLRLVPTPLAWLEGGGSGVCLLSYADEIMRDTIAYSTIRCSGDEDLAELVRSWHLAQMPAIRVR